MTNEEKPGFSLSEFQPGMWRYARLDGEQQIVIFPAKTQLDAESRAIKLYLGWQ